MENHDEKGMKVVAQFQENFYEMETRKGWRRKEKNGLRRDKGKEGRG
jgi:hypothetical protein